ncbi:hypothetical protein [Microlunatus speluncae]|uniref:hypothetical protein n=1 Tax=Microlunatus speluncae TaxID=2594267 RepID=UPI001375FBFB|nr:hypothetical protein [Microlunatus speluncae]
MVRSEVEQAREPADETGEWLELGRRPPRLRDWRWLRPAVITMMAAVIVAVIAAGAIVVRPIWTAEQASLTQDQVRAALERLELENRRLRSMVAAPETSSGADACGALRGLVDVDGPGGLPGVEVTGRVPGDTARVTVSAVLFASPAAAAELFAQIEEALRNPLCLESWELGRLAVDPGPHPNRRLGYLIGMPVGGTGAGDTWWYRARVLRFGNTISYVSLFGPTGAADVTTGLTDALDRTYAELA